MKPVRYLLLVQLGTHPPLLFEAHEVGPLPALGDSVVYLEGWASAYVQKDPFVMVGHEYCARVELIFASLDDQNGINEHESLLTELRMANNPWKEL